MYFRKNNDLQMKQLIFLFLTVWGITACQNKNNFTLQVELEGNIPDTLWVVYDDPTPKIDTVYPEEGKFNYTLQPDTFCLSRILSPYGEVIPLFINRGWKVKITGSMTEPRIEGDGDNGVYGQLLQQLHETKGDSAKTMQTVQHFIRTHQSYASAYLINQYYIQGAQTDKQTIRSVIAPLDGNIKDSYVISSILKDISDKNSNSQQSDYVSYFSCKDRNGKYISWNNAADSYTLINFWASWHPKSITLRDSLYALAAKLPKKQFRVLNISLDYDKKEWLKACKKDEEYWIEICDYKGWENQVIKQKEIRRLPANILVDRNRKIIETNKYGTQLYDKVKELTKSEKEK